MKYTRSEKYNTEEYMSRIMGPNPIKLEEELLHDNKIPRGATVMDLGSGQGVTSAFMAREYGFRVFAADLWGSPTEVMNFLGSVGLSSERVIPLHADAQDLPFAHEFFDAVVSTDSYNYFGRDPKYLGEKLLPFVKHGGYIYIAVPGMHRDLHSDLPQELLRSWTPEQLDYLHDAPYWRGIIEQTEDAEIISIHEMESNEEVWNDWLKRDNEYAVGDRKAMEAGGGRYLNFVAIILRRK